MWRFKSSLMAVLLFTLTLTAQAGEWYVGWSPGDDFTEIQPAIDAASLGDLILVREGHYKSFALNKGVAVRALHAGFDVDQTVAVGRIPPGQRAMLSGATIHAVLYVVDSEGSIVLEKIEVWPHGAAGLVVHDCDDLSVTDLFVYANGSNDPQDNATAATVTRSSMRITGFTIFGATKYIPTWDGSDGGAGMEIDDSIVILAHGSVAGGSGSDGDMGAPSDGGQGGAGVVSHNSDLYVIGTPADMIRGGNGGSVYQDMWGNWLGSPGAGGNGLVVDGGHALVSRVELKGGFGGDGEHRAPDGSDFVGNVERNDTLPWLAMNGPLSPGDQVAIDIDSVGRPGAGILLLAEESGFLHDSGLDGIPYYTSLPGGWYFGLNIGHTNNLGAIGLVGWLPSDPALAGMRLDPQALILGDDGSLAVTNGVSRVVGK